MQGTIGPPIGPLFYADRFLLLEGLGVGELPFVARGPGGTGLDPAREQCELGFFQLPAGGHGQLGVAVTDCVQQTALLRLGGIEHLSAHAARQKGLRRGQAQAALHAFSTVTGQTIRFEHLTHSGPGGFVSEARVAVQCKLRGRVDLPSMQWEPSQGDDD